MSDPPPPSDPPPGWYPDPAGRPGYRWWDGTAWTEAVNSPAQAEDGDIPGRRSGPPAITSATKGAGSPIGSFGLWFSESFRLAVKRAGHFLPMILVFVLSVSIPTSFGIWYAFRNTVIAFDPATGVPDISYGGSTPWLIAVLVSVPVSAVLSYLCKASVARQAWAHQSGAPEPWSDSVRGAVGRWRRVVPACLARSAAYWALGVLVVLAVALSPALILMLPFFGAALLFIWVRMCFVETVAALGGPAEEPAEPVATTRPIVESWRLSGRHIGPLMGRLLVLAVVALNLILAFGILGAPFTAIAGGTGSAVSPTAETLRLDDLLGANPTVFALGSLFNAIGLGAGYVLAAVGTTLLYRNLGGPIGVLDGDPIRSEPSDPSPSTEWNR